MTILEAAAALRSKLISATELTQSCLRQIERLNPKLNAFITVTAEEALASARRADEEFAAGKDRGPLQGIPVAHKDLFCTTGVRTTSGSKLYERFVPNFDAAVVARLREAGAVMVGKTGMHEHAFGITSNNPHYGAIRNPWNLERIPGGSSGGSAVAVATGMALFATGSDTGGSIRCPASYCSVVGLKPTYGRVSKYGVLPLGFSLDHAGPMTSTVRDAAAVLNAIAGFDARDPSSARRAAEDFQPPQPADLKGMKIGIPENFYFDRLDRVVDFEVREMAELARDLGAELVPVRVPDGVQLNNLAQITLLCEAAAVHEPYLRRSRKHYGDDVRILFDTGRLIPATEYIQAQRLRRRIQGVYLSVLAKVDCLLTPATPAAAPAIGQDEAEVGGQKENVRLAATRLLRGINMLGLPALVMPCAWNADGLPFGVQLIGRPFGEAAILKLGAALEDANSKREKPPMAVS